MHKLSNLFKHHCNHSPNDNDVPVPASGNVVSRLPDTSFPRDADLYRYRQQRGVNLGSWFVLERWIADAPFRFASSPAQSDLDVARGSYATQILEKHWDSWITKEDWSWISQRGINTVRIPIGFYHVCGADPSVLEGTEFADLGPVFRGAWSRITNAIATAHRFGLGVLIDLHAAPGKQNNDAHSGSSSKPSFFTEKYNMSHTTDVLITLLTHLTDFARSHDPPLPNLVGIELLNEPAPASHNSDLEKWYKDTMRALRRVDPDIPLYIGDSWMTDQYTGFIEHCGLSGVVLDHHLYRCFTSGDAGTPATQHSKHLTDPNEGTPQMLARSTQALEGVGGALVVGEWSGALNPGSLQGADDQDGARREFVEAQLQLYERSCAGYFFWTYKKEHGGDAGWSFRDAVSNGVFPSWVGLRPRSQLDDGDMPERRDRARDQALGNHSNYWNQYPGDYEHWRFGEGFQQGWNDAYMFMKASSSLPEGSPIPELGFKGPWSKRRVQEHAREKGNKNLWEYEHGVSQGVSSARRDVAERY